MRHMDINEIRRKNAHYLSESVGGITAFADKLDKSQPQISHLIGDKPIKNIGPKIARQIEKAFNKAHGWLDHPHPELWGGEVTGFHDRPANIAPAPPEAYRRIPLIDYIQAGNNIREEKGEYRSEKCIYTDLETGPHTFALIIKDESMEPEFKEGDWVIIDPNVVPQPADYVVAKCNCKACCDEVTFKKYRPRGMNERGEEVFELVPLNDDYPTFRSDVMPFYIIGTMVEHRRYRKR